MMDANSIDTTDVRGSCFRCEGPLAPHHFVQAAGGSALTLCSEECLRAKLRDDMAARAAARQRTVK